MANQTRLLGFNFRRIEVERQDQSPEKVDIVSDIKFENVEKHRVDLVNEEALKIDFEFKLTYKDFAKLSMQGAIILMVDDKAFKDALKEWKKNKKEKGRPFANKTMNDQKGFQVIRNGLLLTIFDEAYKKDKSGINERIITNLGLDGADDVYMAIGTTVNDMKIVSSRSSKAFQKLYDSVKKDFTVRFIIPEDKNIAAAKMELLDNSTQEILLKTTFSFKEGDIFVQFLDMKQILDDDDA